MNPKSDFSDLTTRTLSAIVMLAVAGWAIWQGDTVFKVLLIIAAGLMAWEISRMHDGRKALAVSAGAIVGLCSFLTFFPLGLPFTIILGLQILVALLMAETHRTSKVTVFLSIMVIVFATTALGVFRQEQGLILTLWLLLCIVASDIGGYFAGKLFGGPKLWVRISPKKTWSGTIGGWVLAACVGTVFVYAAGQEIWLIAASVPVAIAAQSGDLAESALKRRAGIKDSSNLIPGHGGLLDRFDGVLGVCFLVWLAGITGYL
ncbi:MAG: phosphatidate cytidylyltransferase [Amylibacter sp.]|nr:phosphatidate cytidylyltransferase [Amylibacter sp.]